MRTRERTPDGALLRLVTTLIASEVERVRAPERASEEAADTSCAPCWPAGSRTATT